LAFSTWFFNSNFLDKQKIIKHILVMFRVVLLALPTTKGKDIVFRFIIEYSSLRDFYRPLGNNNNNNRSIFIWGFFERWYNFWLVLKLEISYKVIIISWRILVSFRGGFFFWRVYFLHGGNIWISISLLLP
jgi:hypothetical protein